MKVAVIGGTGAMGNGLAKHLAKSHHVIIGSRDPERAKASARELQGAEGSDYLGASAEADAVIFAIPYEALDLAAGLGEAASGKLVLSAITPMISEGGIFRHSLTKGSAAQELASLLPGSRLATAFNNIPSGFLKGDVVPPVDVLVAADSSDTYSEAARLVETIREMRPLYVGPLSEARLVEQITPFLRNLASLNGTRALTTRFVTRKG